MTRTQLLVAASALGLTTGMIGFAIGRGTLATPREGVEVGSASRMTVRDSAMPPARDSSSMETVEAAALATQPAGTPPAAGDTNAVANAVTSVTAKATANVVARNGASPGANATDRTDANATNRTNASATSTGRRRVMLGDLDLTAIGYDRGSPDAPLVLIDFSDFGCPHCGEFARETYPAIDREYIRTGKVYLKYVPFLAGFARGREATRAAECAADQGKFWEMADAIYATQAQWQKARDPHAELRGVAGTAGVDTAAYWACYGVHRPDARTRRATDVAEKVQVRVTPSFVLNGRPIEGALPLAEFRKLLDAALLLEASRR